MEKRKIVKLIDILCLMSLNEKIPEEIKYNNQIYNYCDVAKDYYYTCYGINIYLFKTLFSKPTTFLNDEVEVLDNIPSPDNYVPIEKQTKVTPYEPYRCFVEDKDNFTGWKMYQNGKEVCSVDCSRDEEDEFEDIEELEIGYSEKNPSNKYIINEYGTKCYLTKHSRIMADKINQLIKNQKKIIKKLKEEGNQE